MKDLTSVFNLPDSGRVLVEANAGTGKTYAIQGLYARLLVEHRLKVSELLVLTFTRMATRELRTRILARLNDALDALRIGRSHGDPFLEEWIAWAGAQPEADQTLSHAIRDFHEAPIQTIHGFCQSILSDHAGASDVRPGFTVRQDDLTLRRAVEDAWRGLMHADHLDPVERFRRSLCLPSFRNMGGLVGLVRPFIESSSYAAVRSDLAGMDPAAEIAAFHAAKREAVELYRSDRERIHALFRAGVQARFADGWISSLMPLFDGLDVHPESKDARGKVVHLTKVSGTHPFFDLMPAVVRGYSLHDLFRSHMLLEIARRAKAAYEDQLETSQDYRFHDLLKKTAVMLDSPHGEVLAVRLRNSFRFAMLDEFQDTDPLQFGIFDRIFEPGAAAGALYMIGDPKQAIYSFRGADVFTYIKAKSGVDPSKRFSLSTNYRSTPDLVQAVNVLLQNGSFQHPEIVCAPSAAGSSVPHVRYDGIGVASSPFKAIYLGPDASSNKADMRERVRTELLSQIGELLEWIRQGRVRIGDRLAKASDIAILTRTNIMSRTIQRDLQQAGISSASYSKESVFASRDASDLLILLRAVLQPFHLVRRRNLRTTRFIRRIAWIDSDAETDAQGIESPAILLDIRERWMQDGILPAMHHLLTGGEMLDAILAEGGGERSLANLRQLADLIHQQWVDHRMEPSQIPHWLEKRIRDADHGNEEEEFRLETDDQLIRIVTIHKSKGLQYPIVFCPDLWEAKNHSDAGGFVEHHDPSTYGSVLDLSPAGSDGRNRALEQFRIERGSESSRLAYVALTRAANECRVILADAKDPSTSPWFSLFSAAIPPETDKKDAGPAMRRWLADIAARHPSLLTLWMQGSAHGLRPASPAETTPAHAMGSLHLESISESGSVNTLTGYAPRPYMGPRDLHARRRIVQSFTHLARDAHAAGSPGQERLTEEDRWQDEGWAFQRVEEQRGAGYDLRSLPKGPGMGSLLHQLLEDARFRFDATDEEIMSWTPWISDSLSRSGFDPGYADAIRGMLRSVTRCSIKELDMRSVGAHDQVRELEFHLPAGRIDRDRLLDVIRGGSTGHASSKPPAGIERHYLKGFIDLVVRQNDRFYIIDYKSNHLGESDGDYGLDAMRREIHLHAYDMQYHLYSVALIRYLRRTMPEFDMETHFGGVVYLFLRGLHMADGQGAWFDRPCGDTLCRIEHLLERNR